MCGIAGISWNADASPPNPEMLESMTAVLHHRGPDGRGAYVDAQVALLHTRLSIIDVECGAQPLSNEDGTIWVTFNGEIYNFQELRQALVHRGHRFRTATDTEVLVHLYEEHGVDFLPKLRGMFAFAIWDAKHRRLVLARDRYGKKPLVYTVQRDRIVFGSELKAIRASGSAAHEIDPLAVDEFLAFGYIPHPRTIYRGVYKLPPAHYGMYENGRFSLGRYWRPQRASVVSNDEEECCELVRSELTEATRLRMISDVPLGAFLSGGMDSGIVVGLMQRLSNRPVNTFSIRFSSLEFDESAAARETAAFLGTEHHEFHVQESCLEVLPELVWHYDEPFADASALPTYYVAKLAKQEVTVALTGDGGDEVFGGYTRYQKLSAVSRFDAIAPLVRLMGMQQLCQTRLVGQLGGRWRQRASTFIELLTLPHIERIARIANAGFRAGGRQELYSSDFAREVGDFDPLEFIRREYLAFGESDVAASALTIDRLTYLPCDILTKIDIASMANGLECRSPFLDPRVVDLADRLPLAMKLRGREGKSILRRAFQQVLPAEVLRRKKRGFVVPIQRWFRKELREYLRQVILDTRALNRGYFRPQAVERLVQEHTSGQANHSVQLWQLLWLEMWHSQFVDAPVASSALAS